MFDVMRTVEVKKVKPKSAPVKKDDDIVQPGAESFAQTGATKKSEDKEAKEAHCYACGKPGGYVTDCKLRKNIVEKDWFKNSGLEHHKIDGSVHTQIVAAATTVMVPKASSCWARAKTTGKKSPSVAHRGRMRNLIRQPDSVVHR